MFYLHFLYLNSFLQTVYSEWLYMTFLMCVGSSRHLVDMLNFI